MKNFKQKLYNFTEKNLVENSNYIQDWIDRECDVYWANGYGGIKIVYWHEFNSFLHDMFKNETKDELYSWILELHEHIKFTTFECKVFARIFKVKLCSEIADNPILICENKQFQDWVYNEIINYLK